MAIARPVLMVELLLSADRIITAAQAAQATAGGWIGSGGEWPPATVVGHLSMVDHEVWIPRIDAMVAGGATGHPPVFAWWEPDTEATVAEFAGVDADAAGARLLASRTALLHRLRDLSEADWAATAEHETFGSLDVEGLLIQVLSHDEEHRASILLRQPEV